MTCRIELNASGTVRRSWFRQVRHGTGVVRWGETMKITKSRRTRKGPESLAYEY